MDTPNGPAASESGDELTLQDIMADPEIAPWLEFEPVPRAREVPGAWTPERQREFIARLAISGSPTEAARSMGKDETGAKKLYHSPHGTGFRDSWDAVVEIARRRRGTSEPKPFFGEPPSIDRRIKHGRYAAAHEADRPQGDDAHEGEVMNEFGEWEDEDSYAERGEAALDNICTKLLRARRLYLQEISSSPGKRAAFEILTEYPVDWDRAAALEPQDDESFRTSNQREPDMILTADSGWSFGHIGYGPEREAAAQRAIDEHRAEEGLEPVAWHGKEVEE